MSNPKKHHFLSQFYLSGFTLMGKNEAELFCYDIKSKLVRISKPANEGYVKYFNRIDSNSNDPNILEKELAKVESSVANVFRGIQINKELPKNEDFKELIYYIALLSTRNPKIRSDFNSFQQSIASSVFDLMISNKSIWEKQLKIIALEHGNKYKDITFEEMKSFLKEKRWKLVESNENKIKREFDSVDNIYKLLLERNWILLIDESNEDWFVTSDRPVKNIWSKGNNLNYGPGFGIKNSELYFPLSRNIILNGSYNLPSAIVTLNKRHVATLNTLQFLYTERFIYSPTSEFIMLDKDQTITKSSVI
jgi:Protein of unknown function (DUF4238)